MRITKKKRSHHLMLVVRVGTAACKSSPAIRSPLCVVRHSSLCIVCCSCICCPLFPFLCRLSFPCLHCHYSPVCVVVCCSSDRIVVHSPPIHPSLSCCVSSPLFVLSFHADVVSCCCCIAVVQNWNLLPPCEQRLAVAV